MFLDRDGVINKEIGYLYKVEDFEFIDGVFDACLDFQSSGYKIIVVTNQSGIERGYYSVEDFQLVTQWMLEQFKAQGIQILDVFFCPHAPDSNCSCRKPKPGMFNQANDKHNIDMANSWMIGDKEADIQAANAAGISNTVLVKSGHSIDEKNTKAQFVFDSIKQVSKVL
ncbi:D-glycero-beta-D-manno-heptose 1,7-bisphosphate 7-phosphatase [Bathymodiolus heckerae thiotrophic gill symbiont]|uniref:D-glycero-beta-D-manno-heptose 1,7-bisphosphate 7-phosphatase n=1 Tax=Bathymodiolus heckerae thiotrophic gill symbiont TaxID=1052212 RepID=UPI0032081CD4